MDCPLWIALVRSNPKARLPHELRRADDTHFPAMRKFGFALFKKIVQSARDIPQPSVPGSIHPVERVFRHGNGSRTTTFPATARLSDFIHRIGTQHPLLSLAIPRPAHHGNRLARVDVQSRHVHRRRTRHGQRDEILHLL